MHFNAPVLMRGTAYQYATTETFQGMYGYKADSIARVGTEIFVDEFVFPASGGAIKYYIYQG